MVATPPQLKRMTPPLAIALARAVSVQLAAVPEPTVSVVARVSAVNGVGQMAGGLVAADRLPERKRARSKTELIARIPSLSHSIINISTCRRLQTDCALTHHPTLLPCRALPKITPR